VTPDLKTLPKVLLHDHLDGGVRPSTVAELAAGIGYDGLGTVDPEVVAVRLHQGESGSLETYLEAFDHTLAVMQTPEAITRVATEAVEDLAADGVVYAEIRFAPTLHTVGGLNRREVVRAVLDGLHAGSAATGVPAFAILDAMRQDTDSEEIAQLAHTFRGDGVVAFDLAGPERGFPASGHSPACEFVTDRKLHMTLHAGEGDGPASIEDALNCGAERIGHGVRVIEDCTVLDGRITAMGPIASRVHAGQVALEVCPWSNVHTLGIAPGDHPVGLLRDAGFAVTLNTDNRLMSGTSMTAEFTFAVEHHGFTSADFERVTMTAIGAAFCSDGLKDSVRAWIEKGYSAS